MTAAQDLFPHVRCTSLPQRLKVQMKVTHPLKNISLEYDSKHSKTSLMCLIPPNMMRRLNNNNNNNKQAECVKMLIFTVTQINVIQVSSHNFITFHSIPYFIMHTAIL
jgi:hypothetical protein